MSPVTCITISEEDIVCVVNVGDNDQSYAYPIFHHATVDEDNHESQICTWYVCLLCNSEILDKF